jgi:hypothetical protein
VVAILAGLCALASVAVEGGLPSASILVPLAGAYLVSQLAMFRWRLSGLTRALLALLFVSLAGTVAWQLGAAPSPLAWRSALGGAPASPTVTAAQPQPPARDLPASPASGPPVAPAEPSRRGAPELAALANTGGYDCSAIVHAERDIAPIRAAFRGDNLRQSMVALLEQRFPDGAWVVGQLEDPAFFDRWFVRGRGDWAAAMTELSAAVHESVHVVGLGRRRGRTHVLVLSEHERLTFPIPATFPRSAILAALPQPVRALSYTSSYLEGASGAQGFEMVLDELNAYTHSLYVAVAVADQLPGGLRQSARDGVLVLMLYTQAFLRLARLEHDGAYRAIRAGEIGRATVRLYDRAQCALGLAARLENLGIDDAMLWGHLHGPTFDDELAAIRAHPGPEGAR